MKRGDHVWIERDDLKMRAMIVLASANEESLAVMFDGMFHAYVHLMPLLRDDDGVYRDLIEGKPVKLERRYEN